MTHTIDSTHTAHMPDTCSQWGEDILIWRFFGTEYAGVYFEAGAHHPTRLSQTCLLERKGWSGVLVEPSTAEAEAFAQERPRSQLFHYALGSPEQAGQTLDFVIPDGLNAEARLLEPGEKPHPKDTLFSVHMRTLTQVLEEAGVKALDFCSLDLEGYELNALRGMDFKRWRPRLLLIEDHLHNLRIHRYLKAQDYRLVYRLGCNNWYVPKGTPFPLESTQGHLKLFRKLYLSMPFRKLRICLKKWRGLTP